MKFDDHEQFQHGMNYPRPMFVFCGPGHIKIEDPDEMAESLENRHAWERHYQALKLYLKMPFASELIPVWPRYLDETFGEDWPSGMVKFANLVTGELITQDDGESDVALVVSWDPEWDETKEGEDG